MKTTKRLLSCLLVLAMLFALAIPAFAADGGTITIKNTEAGTTYTLYKLFDVETATTATGTGYSYTNINNLSKEQLTAGGFDIVAGHVVSTTGTAPSDQWFHDIVKSAPLSEVDKATSDGKDVSLTASNGGYYFVLRNSDNQTSSVVEFNAETVTGNITIYDKHNHNDPVPEKSDGDRYKTTAAGADISADLGGKVEFTVSFGTSNYADNPLYGQPGAPENTPAYVNVEKYTVVDTPADIDIDIDKLTVTVDGTEIAKDTAYTVSKNVDTGVVTVEIPWVNGTSPNFTPRYNQGDEIVISYEGTVTEKNATNRATITPTVNGEDGTSKEDPTPVNVKSADIEITKVDQENHETLLDGAKFVLINKNLGNDYGKFYKYTPATADTPAKVEWVNDEANATEVTTGADGVKGIATFEGLAAGNYELKETVAPNGYNLMDQNFGVEVTESGEGEDYVVSCDGATVENARGTVLPSTGGIGTTMFYVIGGILVAAAVVVLVSKKRMGAEQ